MAAHHLVKHSAYLPLVLSALAALASGGYTVSKASLKGEVMVMSPCSNLADQISAINQRKSRAPQGEAVTILLRGGTYPLQRPITFTNEISGRTLEAVTIQAAPGERPVLSGGVNITGWQLPESQIHGFPANAKGKIWVANAPMRNGKAIPFRQLWVNGHKAIRAREPNDDNMERLIAWNKNTRTATIPVSVLKGINQPRQLEMVIDQVWEIAVLRVQAIQSSASNAIVTFRQPESDLEFEHPWPPVIVNAHYQAPFFLANAEEFLDTPGEWYEDVESGKIYYWPRAGEDMTNASVIVPVLESLVCIEGTPGKPLPGIQFKGITFAYTTWLRPSEQGHVPLQAGMFLLAAKKLSPKGTPYHHGLDNLAWIGRPPAAVMVKNARHVLFEDCAFEHLAAAGLDFVAGASSNLVQGCTFRDVGGNGMQLGEFSKNNVETHTPWNPQDQREICAHDTIRDNVFSDCGNEDWGCVGICAGYVSNANIAHNALFDLPYSGISLGWGWTKTTNAMRDNLIFANRIQHIGRRLGDLGGIYTLSAQPGTVVAENFIADIAPSRFVPDPAHWFYLYLDEGSSFITVRDNWCPAEKFLKNANGPGNVWTNNGPQVSTRIKNAAGLEPSFQYLLK